MRLLPGGWATGRDWFWGLLGPGGRPLQLPSPPTSWTVGKGCSSHFPGGDPRWAPRTRRGHSRHVGRLSFLRLRLTPGGQATARLRGVDSQVLGTTPKRPPALCSESRNPSHTCRGSDPASEPGLSEGQGHCVCPKPCVLRNVCCHTPGCPPALGTCRRLLHAHRKHTAGAQARRGLSGRAAGGGQARRQLAGPARAPPQSPPSATHRGEACHRLHTPGALSRGRGQRRKRGVCHAWGPPGQGAGQQGPVQAGTPLLSRTWAGWFPEQPAAGLRPGRCHSPLSPGPTFQLGDSVPVLSPGEGQDVRPWAWPHGSAAGAPSWTLAAPAPRRPVGARPRAGSGRHGPCGAPGDPTDREDGSRD